MGFKRGVPQNLPDEYYWRIIDWIIFGRKSLHVLKYSLTSDTPVSHRARGDRYATGPAFNAALVRIRLEGLGRIGWGRHLP